MAVSRIRSVDSARQMDATVDDFVTQGFLVKERGERSTLIKRKEWGTAGGHVLVGLLTVWWTVGLGNLTYGLIKHYTAEEILVKVEES